MTMRTRALLDHLLHEVAQYNARQQLTKTTITIAGGIIDLEAEPVSLGQWSISGGLPWLPWAPPTTPDDLPVNVTPATPEEATNAQ
jgi:hypothetical protein